ncbi:hypothetical protein ACFW5W_07005 [Streptomyces sp. NPDC058783]|uniref:hypothetical protein n=1 Tax=Streptomyces sp. NPDC058783 TaxID=3346633 RepID=UPI0036B79DE0
MNTPKPTRTLRAAQAIKGAHAARRHTRFVTTVARQLDEIAPGTVRVRTIPVTREDRRRTFIVLDAATGPVGADREQHRAAFGLLQRAFPLADWSVPQSYDARTSNLTVDRPTAPAALDLDTPEAHQ